MIFTVILFVILCTSNVYVKADDSNGRTNCEPQSAKYKLGFWKKQMTNTVKRNDTLIVKTIYRSKSLLENVSSGITEKALGSSQTHRYVESLALYQTAQLLPFRRQPNIILIHFISGDDVIIHQIDETTGKYTATELGLNTNQYVGVINSGVWYTLDIKQHTKDKYIFISGSVIRYQPEDDYLEYAKYEDLVAQFPQHEEVITKTF